MVAEASIPESLRVPCFQRLKETCPGACANGAGATGADRLLPLRRCAGSCQTELILSAGFCEERASFFSRILAFGWFFSGNCPEICTGLVLFETDQANRLSRSGRLLFLP